MRLLRFLEGAVMTTIQVAFIAYGMALLAAFVVWVLS